MKIDFSILFEFSNNNTTNQTSLQRYYFFVKIKRKKLLKNSKGTCLLSP